MPEATLSVETAQRIIRDCQAVEDALLGHDDRGPQGQAPFMLRYARITKCALATGFGEIQFCTGNRNNLVLDTSLTVKCGMEKFYRVADYVIVEAVASPDVHWEVVGPVVGWTLYKDPATDGSVLAPAEFQDNPEVDVYCTDAVSVP